MQGARLHLQGGAHHSANPNPNPNPPPPPPSPNPNPNPNPNQVHSAIARSLRKLKKAAFADPCVAESLDYFDYVDR